MLEYSEGKGPETGSLELNFSSESNLKKKIE